MSGPSDRFDQHGPTLTTTDAFGGDAALVTQPFHGIDEMQHDPVAARADRMTDADGAAVDVEPIARDPPSRAVEAEGFAAELCVIPGSEAAQQLRGEGFV